MSKFDLTKIKNRLDRIAPRNIWKAQQGEQIIRIVPYPHEDFDCMPGIEAFFHYNVGGVRSFACPRENFGHTCLVCDLADQLRSTGDDQDFEMFKKVSAKMRIYSPIVVRGLENEGIKWWAYSSKIYQAILQTMKDDEYGDVTDIKEGFDIVFTQLPKAAGQQWPQSEIRFKRKPSKAYSDLAFLLAKLEEFEPFGSLSIMVEKTLTEQKEIMKNLGAETSDEDASDDSPPSKSKAKSKPKDEEEEEEEEAPKSKSKDEEEEAPKSKSKAKSKPKDEEEEEEEEAPKSKSKAKSKPNDEEEEAPKSKSKAKSKPKDEEEEEAFDEEEEEEASDEEEDGDDFKKKFDKLFNRSGS